MGKRKPMKCAICSRKYAGSAQWYCGDFELLSGGRWEGWLIICATCFGVVKEKLRRDSL